MDKTLFKLDLSAEFFYSQNIQIGILLLHIIQPESSVSIQVWDSFSCMKISCLASINIIVFISCTFLDLMSFKPYMLLKGINQFCAQIIYVFSSVYELSLQSLEYL